MARVKSVKPIGVRHVYDIEVRDHHNFLANGLVVHNCTSPGARRLFEKAKPKSIIDIAVLTSIYRPGPLAAKLDKLYLEVDEKPYDWGDQRINKILEKTKGLLIFQEGVMELAEKVAGFPKDKCDEVRRAIMKRSISGGEAAKKAAQETRDSFVKGCIANGYTDKVANNLYDKILYFAGYGFNKAHAVAYAIDSFWCAWLMTYYEEQWLSAYLEAYSTTPVKRAKAFGEARALGYTIVPIDVNHAGLGWTVLPGKKLMPSMTSVKGVGESAVEELMAMRPINQIEDMLWNEDGTWRPSKFNKKALEALIKVGAFESVNCVGEDKVFKSYKHMYETLMGEYVEQVEKKKGSGIMIERIREHANLIKRSTKKDPHEGRKNFYELARALGETDAATEWTARELADFRQFYFGSTDVTQMFEKSGKIRKLEAMDVIPMEDLEYGENKFCWFVTVMATAKKGGKPTSGIQKKTKKGKGYIQAFVTGPVGKPMRLTVWGQVDLLDPFVLYAAEVRRDDYGFATSANKLREVERA